MTPPDGALGERAPPLTQLRSGYALPTLRQRRRIPILIDTQFSPQNSLAPRGSLLGAKGGRDWKRFDSQKRRKGLPQLKRPLPRYFRNYSQQAKSAKEW